MLKLISNFQFPIFKKNKGFTLIELVLVCGILAILSAFVLATANPITQFQKANDGKRKADLAQIQRALETYYQDNSRYPNSDGSYYKIKPGSLALDWGGSWSPYMSALPIDPSNPQRKYAYKSSGQSYWLYASLERGDKDPQACNGGNPCSSLSTNSIPSNSCGGICNYGVSSPNVSP